MLARILTAHTVPRHLLGWATAASVVALLLSAATSWPRSAVVVSALVPWLPAVGSELVWVHRHFRLVAMLYLLVVVHAAGAAIVLLVAATSDGPIALSLAAVLAFGLVCAALKVALDRSHDLWLERAFPQAPGEVLVDATKAAEHLLFRPGAVVTAEGERAEHLYVVAGGAAEVTQVTDSGEVHVRTYGPGEFFGEVGLMRAVPRTATVRAVSSLDVLALDQHGFDLVVQRSPSTAEDLAAVVEARSGRAERREDAVPLPSWTRLAQRMFKHPMAMHYNRLIAVVLLANTVVATYAVAAGGWWSADGSALQSIAFVAQLNFALAIILRQQYVINALAWLATRPPPSWPLRLRWMLGKYYHFGGLHVGAAVAGTLWYLALVGSLAHDRIADVNDVAAANLVVSGVLVGLFVVMVVMATPRLRAAQHDRFEVTHRFCGWAAIVLVWINTIVFVASQRGEDSLTTALLEAPTLWLLVLTTVCAVWPWALLRRVPITVHHPSTHAAVIELDHGVTPPIGSTRPISRHPLVGWHHFANVPAPAGSSGYRMVVSRAGDWTAAFVDDPPPFVSVRGIPTMGVANVRKLFRKVVLVATGSGIGPMLGHLLDPAVPSRLVWVTRNPRRTYGDQLVDEIETAQPDAVIWDTDQRGKPDVLRLAYAAYLSSEAEAVVCIANRHVTWQVVHGLEQRGIPAFGPIWDS